MKTRTNPHLLLTLLAAVIAVSTMILVQMPSAHAQTCFDQVCFATKVTIPQHSDQTEIPLSGAYKYRYFGFKVLSAALYGGYPPDRPTRLVLHYYRSFSPDDFIKSSYKFMSTNPAVPFKDVEKYYQQMNKLYQPVNPGDRYTLTFIPSKGLELALNDRTLGTIENDLFAKSYLDIWLAEYGMSRSLSRGLRGLEE